MTDLPPSNWSSCFPGLRFWESVSPRKLHWPPPLQQSPSQKIWRTSNLPVSEGERASGIPKGKTLKNMILGMNPSQAENAVLSILKLDCTRGKRSKIAKTLGDLPNWPPCLLCWGKIENIRLQTWFFHLKSKTLLFLFVSKLSETRPAAQIFYTYRNIICLAPHI